MEKYWTLILGNFSKYGQNPFISWIVPVADYLESHDPALNSHYNLIESVIC